MTSNTPFFRPKPLGPWVMTLLIAWLCLAVGEVAVARVAAGAPTVPGAAAELGLLAGLAVVHALTLGRLPLLSGPLSPGVLMLLVTSAHSLAGTGLVQRRYPLSPGDLLLMLLVLGGAGEWLERRSPRLASLVAVLAAPAFVMLHSLEVGYYLGGRSTAIETTLAAWPWLLVGLGAVAVFAVAYRAAAPLVAVGAALLLALPLGAAPGPRDLGSDPRPSIVLITVDTLRADEAPAMQTYKRLAAEGTTFTDALAPSGWTLPSMATIVTGVLPQTHGAYRLSDKWPSHGSIRPELPILTEQLKAAGYSTAVVCTNPNLAEEFGFRRGVDTWVNLFKDPPTVYMGLGLLGRGPGLQAQWPSPYDGGLIVDEALRALDSRPNKPFFLWVHTLDNHLPYYHVRIEPESVLFPTFGADLGKKLNVQMLRMGRLWYNAPVRDALRQLYRDEIAYTDRHLDRLLDGLQSRGLMDQTAIVLTSDHGEEFLDHGSFEHGHSLYEELVHVPLVVQTPGGPKGLVSDAPVGLVDLFPTLLSWAGAQGPKGLAGERLDQPIPPERARYLHGNLYNHLAEGVVVGKWKLLRQDGEPRVQLLDRSTGEAKDLSGAEPEVLARLSALLDSLSVHEGEEPELDLDGLKALGYME